MSIRHLLASCAMCSAMCVAAAGGYTVVPVSGVYESLEDFTLTFPDAVKVENAVTGYGNSVRLVPEGMDPASFSGNFCFKMSAEGNTVSYGFRAPFTEEGSYNLYIPKSAVKVDGEGLEEDLLIPYSIGESSAASGDDQSTVDGFTYSVTPSPGVTATVGEVVLTFPDASKVTLGTLNWGNAPRLVKEGLDPTQSGNCNFCFSPKADGNTVRFPLQRTEEAPGTYIFYLNAGVVVVDGTALTTDLQIKYTIEQANYSLEMVDDNILTEIKTLKFEVIPASDIALSEGASVLTLIDTYSGLEYEGTATVEGNVLSVDFAETVTTSSTYSLTIPAGFFLVDGVKSNRDWVFEYRIKGTGDFTYAIQPKEGVVEELENFIVTFEGSRLGIGNISQENNPLILKNNSPVAVDIEARIQGQSIILSLKTPLASKGEYVLVIRRGLITLNGETPENDLRFHYTVGEVSGIDSLEADDETAEYFNLQGVKVKNQSKGIRILKVGGKVQKVVIR